MIPLPTLVAEVLQSKTRASLVRLVDGRYAVADGVPQIGSLFVPYQGAKAEWTYTRALERFERVRGT